MNSNSYAYDCNGNQITRVIGTDTFTLLYDAENRLVEVKKNSVTMATFVYDGDGRRVKSTVNGMMTVFVGGHFEITGSQVTKYYFAGAQRVAMRKNGTLHYMFSDHLGSTSITTDANGNVISELRYKPWGEVRYSSDYAPTNYTYTGQYSDSYINLLWYSSRHYDPELGRFTSPDTIIPAPSNSQGWDRYSYTFNNPVRYTDPDGHFPIIPLLIGIGVVALKVIDYGWTGYDIVKAGSVYLDADATPEAQQDATNTILMAVAFELLEPDEATPGLPIDDVVRHGDDIAEIFYKEAVKNPDSTFAVLGKYFEGDKNSYEVISEIFGGTHLNLERFDDFKKTFGEDKFWDLINEPFIHEIGGKNKPVWLTEIYDNVNDIRGGLRREVDILVDKYHYKFKPGSHWLLPE